MPVDPSGEGRAPETPEFTDLHSSDFPSLGHALERPGMDSENRRSLLAVEENFDLFPCDMNGGDGSRDWLLVWHLARSFFLEQDRLAGELLSNQNPCAHHSFTEYSSAGMAVSKVRRLTIFSLEDFNTTSGLTRSSPSASALLSFAWEFGP